MHKIEINDFVNYQDQRYQVVNIKETKTKGEVVTVQELDSNKQKRIYLKDTTVIFKEIEDAKNNKKEKRINKMMVFYISLFIMFIISFFAIKALNAVLNSSEGLTSNFLTSAFDLKTLSLSLEFFNQGIGNTVDWVANLILFVIIPLSFVVFVIYVIYNAKKKKKNS